MTIFVLINRNKYIKMINKIKIWWIIVIVFLILGFFANGTLSLLLLGIGGFTLGWNIGELISKKYIK